MAQPEFSRHIGSFNTDRKSPAETTLSEAYRLLSGDGESNQLRLARFEAFAIRCLSEKNPMAIPFLLMTGRFGQSAFYPELARYEATDEGAALIDKAKQFLKSGGRIVIPDPNCPAVSYQYLYNPEKPDRTRIRQMVFRVAGNGPILDRPTPVAVASAMIQPRDRQG